MTEDIQNKRTEIKIKPPILVVDDDSNQLKVISGGVPPYNSTSI